jgi:ubiquinone/menaquinone biosynthesis C-methylase UbiE
VLATEEMALLLAPQAGERILDIGCGVGGPARWIAWKFACHVTGVDLTPEFCRAAEELNAAAGMTAQVRILQGSALALPLPDAAFDRAYSQNVVMNIADKAGFFREAGRVLKPGGSLVLSNLGAGPDGPPHYPVPWASLAENSFLATEAETRRDIAAAGLAIVSVEDTTQKLLRAQTALRAKIAAEGRPALSVHLLMGERMWGLQDNTYRSLQEGRLTGIEVVVRKPG